MKKRPRQDKGMRNLLILTCAMAVGTTIYWISVSRKTSVEPVGPSVAEQARGTKTQPAVPPYYSSASAAKPYPKLIPAAYYQRYPLVERAYKDAAEIPGVLAQQPCYCHCNSIGHHSLLDCYASDHASRCLICIKEALLARQMTRRSETPAEIRQAIIHGIWQSVDVRTVSR
ncbi:MAG: CYCXC family (seleno)protein [Acidobacteriota bacterium]